jgi:hypothetical protein
MPTCHYSMPTCDFAMPTCHDSMPTCDYLMRLHDLPRAVIQFLCRLSG